MNAHSYFSRACLWAIVPVLLLTGCQNANSVTKLGAPTADPKINGNTMTHSNHPTTREYLLTLKPGLSEDSQTRTRLRDELSGLPVIGLSSLGHRLYLLKVSPDPGLTAIQNVVANSKMLSAAQPNQRYEINPPKIQILR